MQIGWKRTSFDFMYWNKKKERKKDQHKLKLLLNAQKTKFMTFTRNHSQILENLGILQGAAIERVTFYKYIGKWMDGKLALNVHIDNAASLSYPRQITYLLTSYFHSSGKTRFGNY